MQKNPNRYFLLLTSLLEIIGNSYMLDDFLSREVHKNVEKNDNAFTIEFFNYITQCRDQ